MATTDFLSNMPQYQRALTGLAALPHMQGSSQEHLQKTLADTFNNMGGDAKAWNQTVKSFGGGNAKATDVNIANERRYSDIMQGYSNVFNNMRAEQDGLGNQARQRIADQYGMQQSQAMQNLQSRGLGNTTIGGAVNRGIAADRARAEGDVDAAVQQARMGTYQVPLSQLAFQERRNDQGMDAASYMKLMQMAGANKAQASTPWGTLLGGGLGAGLGSFGGPMGSMAGLSIGSSLGGLLDKIF